MRFILLFSICAILRAAVHALPIPALASGTHSTLSTVVARQIAGNLFDHLAPRAHNEPADHDGSGPHSRGPALDNEAWEQLTDKFLAALDRWEQSTEKLEKADPTTTSPEQRAAMEAQHRELEVEFKKLQKDWSIAHKNRSDPNQGPTPHSAFKYTVYTEQRVTTNPKRDLRPLLTRQLTLNAERPGHEINLQNAVAKHEKLVHAHSNSPNIPLPFVGNWIRDYRHRKVHAAEVKKAEAEAALRNNQVGYEANQHAIDECGELHASEIALPVYQPRR